MIEPEIRLVIKEAIREALVNSFCHRDYIMSQNNEVCIFKDRIEIYNPGSFPQGKTPQDFIDGSERSVKRNPQLAEMLYYSKDVETFETGLRRITNSCNEAGVKVEFQILKSGFVVAFYRDEAGDKREKTGDKKAKTGDKIILFLKDNEKITNKQAREITGLSYSRIGEVFRKMSENGIIEAHGANRNRYYILK